MKLIYPACFYPSDEDEGYTVVVPDLPGCVTEGDTLADAIDMATEAACGWILGELESGKAIPEASDYKSIVPDEKDGFVNLIVLDMDTYTEKNSRKTVRKNVTIPAWLNTYGEEHHINFSNGLQKALLDMINAKQ